MGAGVIGLSTAYHLAKKKYGRIIVLDKGLAGDGSSSRAAGIITGLMFGETSILARKRALALYRATCRPNWTATKFRDVGCLNLFDRASWPGELCGIASPLRSLPGAVRDFSPPVK